MAKNRVPAIDGWFTTGDEPRLIGLHDEGSGSFFFPNPELRKIFLARHAGLVTTKFWKDTQRLIREGEQSDVFPYPRRHRFCNKFRKQRTLRHRNAA